MYSPGPPRKRSCGELWEREAAFGVWRLAFGVWRLAFGVWRSAFDGLRHRSGDGSNGTYATDVTYKSHVSH